MNTNSYDKVFPENRMNKQHERVPVLFLEAGKFEVKPMQRSIRATPFQLACKPQTSGRPAGRRHAGEATRKRTTLNGDRAKCR